MVIALSILATFMLLSFAFALSAMVYDATTSGRGLSNRSVKLVTALYLWPVAIVGSGVLVLALSLVWGLV